MYRRDTLRAVAVGGAAALAGCLDGDADSPRDDGTPSDHEMGSGSVAVRLSAEVRADPDDDEPAADYESVTLESDCLDESRSLGPGEETVVRREDGGETCSFTVLVDGTERHTGGASGAETYELRVAPGGSAGTVRVAVV